MRIWVDADACPRVIKEILFRAADRVRVRLTLVANHHLSTPPSPWIDCMQVARGLDVADHRIVREMEPGDLIVTADIPLARLVIEKGGVGLDPRGDLYTESNIGERLALRDLMDHLRSSGEVTGGPRAIGKPDRMRFANQLDRLLARLAGDA
jgi:uncharacterized protein YaiI (UPF0178 family)